MPFDEKRLAQARDYLGDYLSGENWIGEESTEWFMGLGDHAASLPVDDRRLKRTAEYLQPFLDDDDRIDCAMYPDGRAVRYLENADWGGEYDEYLTGFVDAQAQDWRRWQQMLVEDGDSAEWRQPSEAGPATDLNYVQRSVSLDHDREAPTRSDLVGFAQALPPAEAQALLAAAHPRPGVLGRRAAMVPPPIYSSWEHYLRETTPRERVDWCRKKARKANSDRLISGPIDVRITWGDVMSVLEIAKGRCAHCNSLALEHRPSTPAGHPLPWEHIGRRIGSLGHRIARFNGGSNAVANLCWSCLWCNTWVTERGIGATDHGGYYP